MRLKIIALGLALSASLGLAACGDDVEDDAVVTPPATTEPAATPPPAPSGG